MMATAWILTVLVIASAWAADAPERKQGKSMADQRGLGRTWVEIDGTIYGAKPDERGPIGGGKGYIKVVTGGDRRAANLDQLLAALEKARKGDVIYLDGNVEIDCTERIVTEGLVIAIPEGVTLAGNRGQEGSRGAIIFSDAFRTRPLIRIAGPDVRITGLRIRGPDPKRRLEHHRRAFGKGGKGRGYYYRFPISDGIATAHPRLEIDNCELSAFSHAAVYLKAGDEHHIHHNFIHHNQYQGLGYGVCHNTAFSLIEHNLFNYNRHSIAGTGRPSSGYEAGHNVELGESLSHCFDMHGGRDRKDGTNIAGTRLKIHHNTFRSPRTAIMIRGLPEKQAQIHHNWFYHRTSREAVGSAGRTRVRDNAYDLAEPKLLDPAEGTK